MKFKTIFIFFNLVLLLSFAFIFLMPLFAVGFAFAVDFWRQNWGMALAFLALVAGLDLYFGRQWTFFSFLEKEDWAGLKTYLEGLLFQKSRITSANIRFYI